jgi:hypothetical protein
MDPAFRIISNILKESFNPNTGALRFEQVPGGLQTAPIDTVLLNEDFFDINTTRWISVNDGATGTLALATGLAGGWLNVPTAGADNDYQLLRLSGKPFKFAANKPLYFEARIKLTEANVDDANWVVGLSDTTTTGFLADNGGGPPASYDGAVFFKVDGGTVIQFETSNAGTQVTDTDVGAFTSASTYTLGINFDPNDGITGVVKAYVNGALVATNNITLAGLEEMHVIYGAKAGGAAAETLQIDYVLCQQIR